MSGSLIFVSGVSGAGKSTLIRFVLENSANLICLKTLTTRPQRQGEEDSLEYEFVTNDEYEEARSHSERWDHTKYKGFKYGADVEFIKQRLVQGTDVICSVVPDWQTVEEMTQLYQAKPKTIWIDTPQSVAAERIADDALRASRQEKDGAKQHFDYIFEPAGDVATDCNAFMKLLASMTGKSDNH